MSTASTKAPVDARSSTFHLRPMKLSERHESTATAESLQDGHPERSVGAEINYTKCQYTGPNFETKISRSPALSCPTATCSRQSAPSSQNSRRKGQIWIVSECEASLASEADGHLHVKLR
jgi:hypothetical protein